MLRKWEEIRAKGGVGGGTSGTVYLQKARARTVARILMGCLVIGVRCRWSKRRGGWRREGWK